MTNKDEMYCFLKRIFDRKLMTKFLINIFDYEGLEDFNYISRVSMKEDMVILDVYDNITDNRFNRYCFDFNAKAKSFFNNLKNDVFVTKIAVLNIKEKKDKLIKLAYLFNLSYEKRIKYAKTFLDDVFINLFSK